MIVPSDPHFSVGTRVRIVALPRGIRHCRHIIGYTGTVCGHALSGTQRDITVCFDPDPDKPDSTGFWTFAAEHLAVLDGKQLEMEIG